MPRQNTDGSFFVITFGAALALGAVVARAQQPAPIAANAEAAARPAAREALRELEDEMRELRAMMQAARSEALALRRELEAARAEIASWSARIGPATAAPAEPRSTGERLAKLEEEQDLLGAKVDEHYQTKVESASRYRVKLSGLALLNLFANRGRVDALDVPASARGDVAEGFGATVRQSQFGLEVRGPDLGSARTSAEIRLDLAGAPSYAGAGANAGLLRLRTASVRLDWPRMSLVAGQEPLFFSPLSPTSVASLIVPALSYSGNLWGWVPQVRVERRIDVSEQDGFVLQGGLLDVPAGDTGDYASSGYRSRGAGRPAYAARVAWTRKLSGRELTLGAGGYYSRQDWPAGRRVDGWAALSDWTIPLSSWLELSGELYRGRAIGGIGGALGRSAVSSAPLTGPAQVAGLNDAGGWTQVKLRPAERFEINGAIGADSSFARDERRFGPSRGYPAIGNRSALANVIYRPRSTLLFSVEYRRIRTLFQAHGESAGHVNVGMGVAF
jgi:hypothetical protein